MTPEIKLTAARNARQTVRVTLDDGRVLTGVPERTLTEQHVIRFPEGDRSAFFLPSDVIEVKPA